MERSSRPLKEPFSQEEVAEAMRPILEERERKRPNIRKMSGPNPPTQPVIYTPESLSKWLNEVARTGVAEVAARAYGLRIRHTQYLRQQAPELDRLYKEALELYRDRILGALHHRAVEGVEEPVWYQGEQVGMVRRYSDRLLELTLKKHAPEFRDHSTTDLVHHGGVLLIPATAESRADWLARREKESGGDPDQLREGGHGGPSLPAGELRPAEQEPPADG